MNGQDGVFCLSNYNRDLLFPFPFRANDNLSCVSMYVMYTLLFISMLAKNILCSATFSFFLRLLSSMYGYELWGHNMVVYGSTSLPGRSVVSCRLCVGQFVAPEFFVFLPNGGPSEAS
jgi:hypothetical protein